MDFSKDHRIVMTLDAGGTNFVFSAVQHGNDIINPVQLPSNGHDLNLCLATIENGFDQVIHMVPERPAAISFAFPGPADYPNGIIGDLGNLPAFRGGIALGPMLEMKFDMPVFINNDGDLYAYGEAIAGFLPYINGLLEEKGSPKRFHNLIGFTLGTGFGAGIVRNGELFIGDNSGAGEVWLLRNKLDPDMNAEEGVSIRAVQRAYAEKTGIAIEEAPTPRDLFEIGVGKKEGNREAAVYAFNRMAEVLGDAIADVLTLIDGIAVIGGGIAGAAPLFMPKLIEEMNGTYTNPRGETFRRLAPQAFDLEDKEQLSRFLKGESKQITIPGSTEKVSYDPLSRVGVGISKIGTAKAVSLGAFAFALNELS